MPGEGSRSGFSESVTGDAAAKAGVDPSIDQSRSIDPSRLSGSSGKRHATAGRSSSFSEVDSKSIR
jgi:hypothetical protein